MTGSERIQVEQHVGQAGGDAAQQVEEYELDPAQPVLDIVAEDPQEQHVAQQVQPGTVHEQREQQAERGEVRRW